jgi:dephospho-CoA kinase
MSEVIIGLTGGIGCGKSTVAALFAHLGIDIVDADLIAKQLVEPGLAAFNEIVDHFGQTILMDDYTLDRGKLAGIIFQHPQQKEWLETLLHPLIREEIIKQSAAAQSPYVVIDIPLLTEHVAQYPFVHRVLVIDAPKKVQIERAMKRRGKTKAQVEAIIAHQASREERLAIASDTIINNKDLAHLQQSVDQLHLYYLNNG